MVKLTKEEREIKAAVERGEWRSVHNLKFERKHYKHHAEATLKRGREGQAPGNPLAHE